MANDQRPRDDDSRASNRVRPVQQREQREQSQDATFAAQDHVTERFAAALGALIQAAAALPVCDRAAKLHAIMMRISDAPDSMHARDSVAALVDASELAVSEDPWRRFHLAALHVAAAVESRRL